MSHFTNGYQLVRAIHTQNANIAQCFLLMTSKGQWHPDDLINFKKIEKSSDKTFRGVKLVLVKVSSVAEWVFACLCVVDKHWHKYLPIN